MCNYPKIKRGFMNIKKDFGARIKELRSKRGITQYQLAEIVGINPKHMSHIETDRSFPKADLIEKFANALHIDYHKFFESEHLQPRDILINNISKFIVTMPENDLRNVYKLINIYFN